MGSYSRKATFKLSVAKDKEVTFVAVNKRGHYVCKQVGRKSKIAKSQLKELVGKGSYTFWFYDKTGTLKPIKF